MDTLTQDNSSGSRGSSKTVDKFAFADGRRYHNEPNCPYPLPNDLEEVSRLDIQHYAIQQVTQKRYHAPLESPRRALDIATGTGIWMMEMASDFPECEFTGVDIAPLQPTTVLPPNCTFKAANLLEGFSYPDGYFDYVRHSLLVAAIPEGKWMPYVQECARICASGGWVEMVEISSRGQGGGPVLQRLGKMLVEAFRARGLGSDTADELDKLMIEAGLVDVVAKEYKVSIGSRGGSAGELFFRDISMGQIALAPLYAKTHGMAREELEQLVLQTEEEIKHYEMSLFLRIYIGRKP
ncbi:S-adenosyl-L-methionine-dependent methyltransferase [Thamnocephalis sphaerospora]|uniref:S-adenosyl-L-methionine-dependent methyltransferase n=1 Tax=Thamnocephalis sphaerospora TaxID=78915 RepID=A0A4P9XRI2_9FUNG|nr:S-adenosyl-L-methionine-dependent methyltransferase [Thamnocephalis sphaerospora]|eukprot:RKP08693.1 S-adenosyl-L-methionine-dependent methyltransferase [Thamnocephalis sphaerospora]